MACQIYKAFRTALHDEAASFVELAESGSGTECTDGLSEFHKPLQFHRKH